VPLSGPDAAAPTGVGRPQRVWAEPGVHGAPRRGALDVASGDLPPYPGVQSAVAQAST